MDTGNKFKRVVVAMQGAGYRIDIVGGKGKQVLFAYPPCESGYSKNRWMAMLNGKHKEIFYPQRKKDGSHIYGSIKNRVSVDMMMDIVEGKNEFSFDD